MKIQYFCENDRRKRDVFNHATLNGIDYLEISGLEDSQNNILPQRVIEVYFLKDLDDVEISKTNINIEGGQRVKLIELHDVRKDENIKNLLRIELNNYGDFSIYRLSIVSGTGSRRSPDWLDPILSTLDFSFKVNCPSDFDCAPDESCQQQQLTNPEIDYLAKDYASFRQLMLDRMSVTLPQWQERNPTDLGVAAVEILAYAADHLSYYQDAVATEAYLNTARRRVSVRRHARLLDYAIHDGNNARTWMALEVGAGADGHTLRTHTPFFTEKPDRVVVEDLTDRVVENTPPAISIPTYDCYTLLATEQIVLGKSVHIFHGHIGVINSLAGHKSFHSDEDDDDDDGLRYSQNYNLVIGDKAHLNDEGFGLFADRIFLGDKVKIQDVYANHVNDLSGVVGNVYDTLALPMPVSIPQMPEVELGDKGVVIYKGRRRKLDAGKYKGLKAYDNAKLTLTGGVYHFSSWDIKENVKITLLGDCEIRINDTLTTEDKVHINQADEEEHASGSSLLIYVLGKDHEHEHEYEHEYEYEHKHGHRDRDDDDDDDEDEYERKGKGKGKSKSKGKRGLARGISQGIGHVIGHGLGHGRGHDHDDEHDDHDHDDKHKHDHRHHKDYDDHRCHYAVKIGEKNHLELTLIVADAGIKIEEKTHIVGSLIARCIKAEKYTKFWLDKEDAQDHRCKIIPQDNTQQLILGRNCISELEGNVTVFESMHELKLLTSRNRMEFYTWGDKECCLPRGATRASLDNHDASLDELKPGELLLFEEIASINGSEADADPKHRHVVRLMQVEFVNDPLYADRRVVNISWPEEDALPFALCLHQVEIDNPSENLTDQDTSPGTSLIRSMSLVRGNILLADHGRSICSEPLVPEMVAEFGDYRPRLAESHTTYREFLSQQQLNQLPANTLLAQDPRKALPAIELNEDEQQSWRVQRDLLNSDRFAAEFVAESEDNGRMFMRFGDNVLGRRPMSGSRFTATYRVGNGLAGNVGAESIRHLALPETEASIASEITRIRNPLSASGGCEAESTSDVKLFAPQAFRQQRRAVTLQDYVEMAQTHPEVQKAEASQRWTGSWHTIFITIDRTLGREVNAAFEKSLRDYLEPMRMMGHQLEISAPRLAALDIALLVCVKEGYLRSEVKAALFEVFSREALDDGRLGFFHPDNWTFGQSVYASTVIETAMKTTGVRWVELQRFQRRGSLAVVDQIPAEIPMARLEIARLDNDPNAPENGRIEFNLEGGL